MMGLDGRSRSQLLLLDLLGDSLQPLPLHIAAPASTLVRTRHAVTPAPVSPVLLLVLYPNRGAGFRT
jgi:hypothetical protein